MCHFPEDDYQIKRMVKVHFKFDMLILLFLIGILKPFWKTINALTYWNFR